MINGTRTVYISIPFYSECLYKSWSQAGFDPPKQREDCYQSATLLQATTAGYNYFIKFFKNKKFYLKPTTYGANSYDRINVTENWLEYDHKIMTITNLNQKFDIDEP